MYNSPLSIITAVWLPPQRRTLGTGYDLGSASISNGADDYSNDESPTPSYPSVFLPTENKKPSPETKAAW